MAIIKKFDFTSLNLGPLDLERDPATGRAYDNYFEFRQQGDKAPYEMVRLSDEITHPSFPNSLKIEIDWKYPRFNNDDVTLVYRTEVASRFPDLTDAHWGSFTVVFTTVGIEAGMVFYQIIRGKQILTIRAINDQLLIRLRENQSRERLNYYFNNKLTANVPITFIYKTNMKYGSGEYFKLWMNGELLVDYVGDVTDIKAQRSVSQVKMGAYISGWNNNTYDENGDYVFFMEDGAGNLVPRDPFPADPNHTEHYYTAISFANILDNDLHTYKEIHPDGDTPLSGVEAPLPVTLDFASYPSGSGTVVDERVKPQYYTGDTIILTANPNPGKILLRWELNGQEAGNDEALSLVVTEEAIKVVAVYEESSIAVKYSNGFSPIT